MARLCYEEAMTYALIRKTFGKTLVQHQLIRYKLAEMARQIESLQDYVERVAYQFASGLLEIFLFFFLFFFNCFCFISLISRFFFFRCPRCKNGRRMRFIESASK